MGNTKCRPRQLKLTEEDIKFLQENTEMEAKDIQVRKYNLKCKLSGEDLYDGNKQK